MNINSIPTAEPIARLIEEFHKLPGIGPKSADVILNARQHNHLTGLEDLNRMGINARRAAPFILLDGRRPAFQHAFL